MRETGSKQNLVGLERRRKKRESRARGLRVEVARE